MRTGYRSVITMGCPAGIGPEIILKAGAANKISYSETVVFGDASVLEYYRKKYSLKIKFNYLECPDSDALETDSLNIYDFKNCPIEKIEIGRINKTAGKASIDYIAAAVDFALKKKFGALITCPINKDSINRAGCNFPGHTELLGYLTDTKNFGMMLAGKYLKVLLVTTHTALKNVASEISAKKIFDMLKLADASLKKDFAVRKPRIAVLALNPHNGENGLFGNEESRIIMPAVKKAVRWGINASGPFAADTLFPKVEKNYDCVICMYHDQGLIPLKLISFGGGVNITLGLPIVRTSVDHGTAYDIAGQNKAHYGSLVEALQTAKIIARARRRS